MKQRLFNIFVCMGFFLPFFIEASSCEPFQIQRPDGSLLTGYITLPDNRDTYPVAFMVHGSPCSSIKPWHEDFDHIAHNYGSALVTLEKQGIYSEDEKDFFEYDQTNTFDHRVEDHLLFIQKMREGELIPQWNGIIAIIGGSEGGRVSITLSSQIPEVKATMLFCCGGGLACTEELKLVFLKYMISFGQSDKEIANDMQALDEKIHEIINNPVTDQYFLTYTYKWWASHFAHDFLGELLSIDHPIFYVHGAADPVIPVESADRVAEAFREKGKENLIYLRLHDQEHDMRQFPPAVTLAMFKMLNGIQLHP